MDKKELEKNYRAEYFIDEKGEEKVKYVYVGCTYELTAPKNLTLFKVLYCLFVALTIPAYVLPFCFTCGVIRQVYFTLPFALQILAMLYLAWAAFKLVVQTPPYNEKSRHTIFVYSKVACFVGEILSVGSLIAAALHIVKNGSSGYDYLAIAFTALLAALFFAVYIVISCAKLNRLEPPVSEPNQPENE